MGSLNHRIYTRCVVYIHTLVYAWLLFLNAHDSFIFPSYMHRCTPTYCGSRTTQCTLTCMLIRDFKMQPRFRTSRCNELLLIKRETYSRDAMRPSSLSSSFYSIRKSRYAFCRLDWGNCNCTPHTRSVQKFNRVNNY